MNGNIEASVYKMLSDYTGIEIEKILPSSNLVEDLEANSLDLVEILMIFEDEYNLEVPDDDLENLQDVQSIVDYLHRKLSITPPIQTQPDTSWNEDIRGPQMSSTRGRTIYKYQMPVLERFTMQLPTGAQILRVDDQDGYFWLWALIDTEAPLTERHFVAVKTGGTIPEDAKGLLYIGFCKIFVQMELGLYIFEEFPS